MQTSGEVIVRRDGESSGATYSVAGPMVSAKTHNETRSVGLGGIWQGK